MQQFQPALLGLPKVYCHYQKFTYLDQASLTRISVFLCPLTNPIMQGASMYFIYDYLKICKKVLSAVTPSILEISKIHHHYLKFLQKAWTHITSIFSSLVATPQVYFCITLCNFVKKVILVLPQNLLCFKQSHIDIAIIT